VPPDETGWIYETYDEMSNAENVLVRKIVWRYCYLRSYKSWLVKILNYMFKKPVL